MKKPSRFLRVFGVAGLLIGLLAATVAPAAAQTNGDDDVDDAIVDIARSFEVLFDFDDPGFLSGENSIFYPWVANDDDFGLGPSDTSISVQNLEAENAQIFIYVGEGDGGFRLETTAFLSAYAAKSFHAEDLGIEEGSGAPVVVAAFNLTGDGTGGVDDSDFPNATVGSILAETPVILSKPEGVGGDFTQVIACVVNAYNSTGTFGTPVGFVVAADFEFEGVEYSPDDDDDTTDENSVFVGSFTQADLQDILEDAQDDGDDSTELVNPFGGLNDDGDCGDARLAGTPGSLLDSVAIGGVAKQAVDGESLPTTTSDDTAVSGYNALNGLELAQFDQHYLPIVQTNCGPGGCWDTVIRVANLNNLNSAVTIRFFPADDGSGSLATGFQIQASLDGGDVWNVNLSDLVPEGWVGSAHILSDGAVFAMADRYKVGYNMWLTNTSSSAGFENAAQVENAQGNYVLFAPHVLLDYFGWNTGINVANLVGEDNNISIQYFNLLGNATEVLNQRLAANGMTYFYDPSQAPQDIGEQDVTTDPNANIVGSALIWSEHPVAAAVDATKYPESDPNGGEDLFQGTSYSATQNVFEFQAVPLVQKGSPVDGMGDTSGINIMNPNSEAAVVNVRYVNPSGFSATNFGVSSVSIPGFANGFVYTMTQRNLPNGFTGAALLTSNVPVAAVSANVNYAVDGDGSAIFNAFNPCGFFRVAGDDDCFFGDPFDTTGRSFTKTFVDQFGDVVPGVGFSIVSTNGDFPFQRNGFSGPDGTRTFENLPVGDFELFVDSVPAGFDDIDSDDVLDSFRITSGADVELTNTIQRTLVGFTKTVVAAGTGDDLDQDGEIDAGTGITLEGVDVVVFERVGTDSVGGPVLGEVVFEGQTGVGGIATGDLPAGSYVLCLFDADSTATTSTGETVTVELGVTADGSCEEGFDEFTVGDDDDDTDLVNEVDVTGNLGGLTIVTRDEDEVEGSVPVEVFVLADGETCADVVIGTDTGITATTDPVTGEVTLSDLAAGTYCVVADFLGDGIDVNDEQGEVTVPDGGSATITLDPFRDAFVDGALDIYTTDGIFAVVDVDVAVFAGTCADVDVVADTALAVDMTDTFTGEVVVDGLADGDVCAVADFDDDGFDVDDVSSDATVVVGTVVNVTLTDV